MKYTGIVRRIDELGRVVIPKELRRIRGIEAGDPIEIMVDGDMICLQKYKPANGCIICSGTEQLMFVDGALICRTCGVKVVDMFIED